MKKPTGSIRFRFYKSETKKTEPNKKNRAKPKKPSQTGLSRFLSKKPNRTETGRFEPVSVRFWFFFLKFGLIIFFYKNRTKLKIITFTRNQRKSQRQNYRRIINIPSHCKLSDCLKNNNHCSFIKLKRKKKFMFGFNELENLCLGSKRKPFFFYLI